MRSTFHGLETARRALNTQQAALHTTGHNIANANTEGYSRQRVNFTQTEPYPKAGLNRPDIPGQLGTGVKAGAIQRIREDFLDTQYRAENSKHGYWSGRHVSLEKMEDIMNEPSEDGLAKTLDRFWTALQDLSVHPEDSGARSVVRQRGLAVAETFNYTADSLKTIQRDLKSQMDVTVNEVNSLTRQINNINKQIASVEPHGYLPNDLYDVRDLLVDRLSEIVNVKVEPVGSGGKALDIAEGKYTIKLIDDNGRDMGVTLVDGLRLETNELRIDYDEDSGLVNNVYFASSKALEGNKDFNYQTAGGVSIFNVEEFKAVGRLKAEMEAYGYLVSGEEKGLYPEMLQNLDQMVYTFVEEFNAVHRAGWNLNEIASGEKSDPPIDFFDFGSLVFTGDDFQGAASNLKLSNKIIEGLDNIAASAKADSVFARMVHGDEEGPSVRGIYSGSGTAADPQNLFVRFHQPDPSEEGSWQYIFLNDEPEDWATMNEAVWSVFNTNDSEATVTTVDGLTIDATGIHKNGAIWQHDNLVNGTRAIGFSGDGSNALALANVKDANLNFGGTTTNVQSFYQGVIGDMAVNTNEADRMMRNADQLRLSVDQRRDSVSAVSLDEEMTNLIQFQHAYNAAARTITLVDEMLDRIINGMGTAGR